MPGVRAPGHLRTERGGVDGHLGVERGARLACAAPATARPPRRSPPAPPGRPSRYAKVTSSGAIMPARAPASIDMLQIVMRPFDRKRLDRLAGVLDRMTGGAGGADLADRAEDQVLRGDAEARLALVGDAHRLGLAPARRHCVASTCSTSDVPTGIASAPSAPWVEVCESPQAIVMPGLREPELRPDHVHDALAPAAHPVVGDAELLAVALQRRDLGAREVVGDRVQAGALARVRRARCGRRWQACGRGARTLRPASRRPSNACAEVTSWTRWRST